MSKLFPNGEGPPRAAMLVTRLRSRVDKLTSAVHYHYFRQPSWLPPNSVPLPAGVDASFYVEQLKAAIGRIAIDDLSGRVPKRIVNIGCGAEDWARKLIKVLKMAEAKGWTSPRSS